MDGMRWTEFVKEEGEPPGGALNTWCEALFEKNGCRKFALILEKPEIDENLPTPLSWDAKLTSTGKPIESSDLLKTGFRSHIKRGFWKVSAHLVKSRSFVELSPYVSGKWWKNDENHEKIENLKIDQGSFGKLPWASGNFWWFLMIFYESGMHFRLRKNLEKYHWNYENHDFFLNKLFKECWAPLPVGSFPQEASRAVQS